MATDRIILRLAHVIGKRRSVLSAEKWAALSRRFAIFCHRQQYNIQWSLPPTPEWYDHNLDVYYQWPKTSVSYWAERGCYNRLAIRQNSSLLELCCGDGFNTQLFYSVQAGKIIAIDQDESAIRFAQKHHQAANIEYRLGDIRTQMPDGEFDNIIWDAAIDYFEKSDVEKILELIKARLKANGILSGYVQKKQGHEHFVHHKYEILSKQDLAGLLSPHFANIKILETSYEERHNLYFFASNGQLPLDSEWTVS